MKKENTAKNQHYIPEMLLKYFTNSEGKLFEAYLVGEKKVYQTSPSNSMSERFVYEDDQLEKNTVEKFFCSIETKIAPQVKKLIEDLEGYKSKTVEFIKIKNSIENLLPTIIIFYYRSGALLKEFSSVDEKHKIPSLSRKILNQGYIKALAETIRKFYKFAIIESDCDFLMSDQYMSTASLNIKGMFTNVSNRHIGLKETIIFIPISSKYYAVYWNSQNSFNLREDEINKMNEGAIEIVNKTIINNSYIKCIGPKKSNLEAALDSYKWASPSQVYVGYESGASSGYINKKEVFYQEIDYKAWELLSRMDKPQEYLAAERNVFCPCGSGEKFKRCHMEIINRIRIPIKNILDGTHTKINYSVGNTAIELPIDEWQSYK